MDTRARNSHLSRGGVSKLSQQWTKPSLNIFPISLRQPTELLYPCSAGHRGGCSASPPIIYSHQPDDDRANGSARGTTLRPTHRDRRTDIPDAHTDRLHQLSPDALARCSTRTVREAVGMKAHGQAAVVVTICCSFDGLQLLWGPTQYPGTHNPF
jgi:hypothetical protein